MENEDIENNEVSRPLLLDNNQNNNYNNDINKINQRELALLAFLNKNPVEEKEYYYKNHIPEKYFTSQLGIEILNFRNTLLILIVLESLACCWGFSYYFIRRSMIYIVVNVGFLITAIIGMLSLIFIYQLGLIIYVMINISLPGAFFIYQMVELFFIKTNNDQALSDNNLLFIFSLPYVYDFSVGLVCFAFIFKISKYNMIIKENRDKKHHEVVEYLENISCKYNADEVDVLVKQRSSNNNK